MRRERHIEIAHAERMQRVECRTNDRRGSRDCAGFAAALGPERVVRAGLGFIALADQVREVDPETGVIALVGYWAVDDVGTVINPMICLLYTSDAADE